MPLPPGDPRAVTTLSFTMPSRSRARQYVSTALLVQAVDATTSWHEGGAGHTILFMECDPERAPKVRNVVVSAHPKVVDTTDREDGAAAQPAGARRSTGKHRR